jgi:hypothetical protein
MSGQDRKAIDEALARFLDGEPEPNDGELLAGAMRADGRFAREVARLLMVDDLLRQAAVPDDRAFLEALQWRLAAERDGGRFLRRMARRVRRGVTPASPRRPRLPWIVTIAAVLVVGLGVLLRQRGHREAVIAPRPSPRIAPATVLDGLAMVVELDGVRWEPRDVPPPAEGDILAAGRLRLRSGLASLAFLSGVTLTLEGPADVELVSIDRVFCRRGKLRVRVPGGAEGFVVATPTSAVVDLGTEFALNVEADGRARIMIVEGAAEAALLDAAGAPLQTRFLGQSKAFALDPGTGLITEAAARPDSFVPAPASAVPPLVLDPGYADAVMGSRPRGYWRFESLAGGAAPNEVPGGSALRVNGPVGLSGGPPGNRCAVFRAGAPDQYMTTDNLWDLAREPGHAVEFWFLAEGISRAFLVGLFPPRALDPTERGPRYFHTFLVELTVRQRQSLNKPASVRFLHGWPFDIKAESNTYSGTYVPRRWHHVVAQKRGDRMELYFDGVPGRPMPIEADYPTLSCKLVVGRRTPNPLDPHDTRPFVGRLDELVIYDHPLSAEEVQHHFHLATPGRRPGAVPLEEERR